MRVCSGMDMIRVPKKSFSKKKTKRKSDLQSQSNVSTGKKESNSTYSRTEILNQLAKVTESIKYLNSVLSEDLFGLWYEGFLTPEDIRYTICSLRDNVDVVLKNFHVFSSVRDYLDGLEKILE